MKVDEKYYSGWSSAGRPAGRPGLFGTKTTQPKLKLGLGLSLAIISSNDLINHEEGIVKIQNANFIPVTLEYCKSAVQTIICLDSGSCVNIIS